MHDWDDVGQIGFEDSYHLESMDRRTEVTLV